MIFKKANRALYNEIMKCLDEVILGYIWKKAPAGSALLLVIDNNNYLQSASIVRDDNISWELHNIYHAQYLHGFLSPIACEKAKMILSRYYMIHGMEGNYGKRIPTKTVC